MSIALCSVAQTNDALAISATTLKATHKPVVTAGDVIENEYIFLLNNARSYTQKNRIIEIERLLNTYKIQPNRMFNHLGGFSATINGKIPSLSKADSHWSIAADVVGELDSRELQTGFVFGNHPWGLDRIDDPFHTLNFSYQYYNDGASVDAYVVDSGIRATHEDFGDRVHPGFTAFDDGWGTNDCDFHGTAVASVIGGTWHGVAKNINLIPVKVQNCTQNIITTSSIIDGLNWILGEVRASNRPSVINISVSTGITFSGANQQFVNVIRDLREEGVVVVVSASNSNDDACHYVPANTPEAITVGATTRSDKRQSLSNFGSCLDIFAPGENIPAADGRSDDSTLLGVSGTSVAAPHVTGVAAQILEHYAQFGYSGLALSEFVEQRLVHASLYIDNIDETNDDSPKHLLSNFRHGLYDEAPHMSGMSCTRQAVTGTLVIRWNPQPAGSFVLESSGQEIANFMIDGFRSSTIIDDPLPLSEPISIRMFVSGVTGQYPNWSDWVTCL